MPGKVIGGSARRGTAVGISFGKLIIGFRSINRSLIENVELLTEENKKRILSALGWGAAGLLIHPVGAVAGLVFGGRTKEVSYVIYLTDGRNYLVKSDVGTFQRVKALSLSKRR